MAHTPKMAEPAPEFGMDQVVTAGEVTGTIIGIATYAPKVTATVSYYVEFIGRQTGLPCREWFDSHELKAT